MKDIVGFGADLIVVDTPVVKAKNVLSVQLSSLHYAKTFGIDLKFFLSEEFQFTNESFKAYLLRRLTENYIDVASVVEVTQNLSTILGFNISGNEENTGFVR